MSMDKDEQLQSIDTTTLTPLVQRATGRPTIELGDWSLQQIYAGTSDALGLYRFRGEAVDQGSSVRWSLVLKALGRPAQPSEPTHWNYWKREWHAYQSGLLTDLPGGLKAPSCLAAVEQSGEVVWLWLEDITEDSHSSWSTADYGNVAYRCGQFNGIFLTERPLPTYPWLSRNWIRGFVEDNARFVTELSRSLEHPWVKRSYPSDVAEGLLRTWADRDQYLHTLEGLPQTLCHLDVFRRNVLLWPGLEGEPELVLIDWASIGHGALGEELVPLIVASTLFFEVELLDAQELEGHVFARYLEGLRDVGWRGDPGLVWLGYASAAALRYGVGALMFELPVVLDERLHPHEERSFEGRSIVEILERWREVNRRFTLRLAHEARALIDKLG
jgi:hypothetical protein